MHRLVALALVLLVALTPAVHALSQSQPRQTVQDYIRTVQVGNPVRYRNLSIFPVLGRATRPVSMLSLDEAIRSQQLIVSEIGEGQVNDLYVENLSKLPVFIMAGEILNGAKQNRVTQTDVIIPPLSGRIDVSAFCVEHGRWAYGDASKATFGSGGYITNPANRAAAQGSKSQSEVWAEVEKSNNHLKVASPTHAMDEAYRAPEVRDSLEDFVRHFVDMPRNTPNMQGAVVVVGSRILVSDCFGDNLMATRLWEKLVRSYALEALQNEPAKRPMESARLPINTQEARDFLNRALLANYVETKTAGTGHVLDISSGNLTGSALVYANQPIHVALYPYLTAYQPADPQESVQPIQRTYPRY